MASCSSSASRSPNLSLPSTGCDDVGRRHRDGKPSSAITRRISPPLICSLCRRSTSSFSMGWRSSVSGDAVWSGPMLPPTQPLNGSLARSPKPSLGTRRPATSSAIEIAPTASSSERGSGRWVSATDQPHLAHPGKTDTPNGSSARSGENASTMSWSWARPICGGSSEPMPTTTIAPAPISLSRRTPLSAVLSRRLDRSWPSQSSVGFTTDTPGWLKW
jgi:hypothetical protein